MTMKRWHVLTLAFLFGLLLFAAPGLASPANQLPFLDPQTGILADAPQSVVRPPIAGADTQTAACVNDGYEDNDSCQEAVLITPGTYPDLQICTGDHDWFGVDILARQTVTITILFSHSQGDLDLVLYDSDCVTQRAYSGSSTDDEQIVYTPLYGGIHHFDVYGYQDAENTYDLIVTTSPVAPCADDGFEENDSCEQAALVSPGTYTGLHVCPSDDDWYAVDLQEGDTITATILFAHAEGDLDMALHYPNCELLAASQSSTDNEQLVYQAASAGTYHIRVYGFRGAENDYDLIVEAPSAASTATPTPTRTPTATPTSTGTPTRTPTATPTVTSTPTRTPTAAPTGPVTCVDDAYEENDVCGQAKLLAPGTYMGLQMCNGENDWFGANLKAGEILTVTITFSDALGNLDLALYDAGCGSLLKSSHTNNDTERVTHTATADGKYPFVVYRGGTDMENSYEMVVEVSLEARPRVYLPVVLKNWH
jgi:hypothetical protein